MSTYITEAFKQFDLLESTEEFNVDTNGIEKMDSFLDQAMSTDIDDVEVIDIEAENEEDLKDSYVGKVICKCNVCETLVYMNKEDIHIEEDVVNKDQECPYCSSMEGYTIIGQVEPYKENEEEPEEEINTSIKEAMKLDGVKKLRGVKALKKRKDKDGIKTLRGRANSKISGTEDIKESIKKARRRKQLQEAIENINIDTEDETIEIETKEDNGVSINTTPKKEIVEPKEEIIPEENKEVIKPLTDKEESEILGNVDNETFDEFDEETFDTLGESYLTRCYENVKSFKTTNAKLNKKGDLKLEGVINFKSGARKKTSFIFENKRVARNKVILEGYNNPISKGKKSFRLKGSVKDNKFICESLNYNYNVNKTPVRGRVRVK